MRKAITGTWSLVLGLYVTFMRLFQRANTLQYPDETVQLPVGSKGQLFNNVDDCIGCGLCVSTCPTASLSLKRKPESEQVKVPKDGIAAAIEHGRARGKLRLGELIKMQAKSKIDRFLAPRL